MKSLIAAVLLLCASGARAGSGAAVAKVLTFNPNTRQGTADVQGDKPTFVAPANVSLKPGDKIKFMGMPGMTGWTNIVFLGKVDDTPPPPPAPAPAASTSSLLKGVVKSYDPVAHQGTLAPATGGRDLVFAVDPKVKTEPKPGAKVGYVEVMVTSVEP